MIDLKQLKLRTEAISVLKCVLEDKGLASLISLCAETNEDKAIRYYADYFRALAENDCVNDSLRYVQKLIQASENIFAYAAASKQKIAQSVHDAVGLELMTLYDLGSLNIDDFKILQKHTDFLPKFLNGELPRFDAGRLEKFHLKNGFGVFTKSVAFRWDCETKSFVPIMNISPITLDNLKEYEEERAVIIENTENFLSRLPSNNVLLYGDRGTGKSSTVHAILNKYAPKGLRLIELLKSDIGDLKIITHKLSKLNNRFIVFIDDLTFIEGADNYAELKAALEGTVFKSDNIIIYATTNRRHLIKESHIDRSDDVHAGDTIQEQLSLSDRFGLIVTFINPDRQQFISILKAILIERKTQVDEQILSQTAERYALKKGGRSPRAAKQLADMIESRIRRGLDLSNLV